jgi:hypothetical protein
MMNLSSVCSSARSLTRRSVAVFPRSHHFEPAYSINMERSSASSITVDTFGPASLRQHTGKNFLDLPGGEPNPQSQCDILLTACTEIRNFIYELAAEQSKPAKLLYNPIDTPHNTRWPLNLAHTCRQIRAEYMPIYLKDTAVEIPYYDINLYLDTFVDPQVKRSQLKDVVCNVMLRAKHENEEEYGLMVDLLPLARLHANCPRMKVLFKVTQESGAVDDEALLGACINKQRSPIWSAILQTKISQIYVWTTNSTGLVTLMTVEDAYAEEWMTDGLYDEERRHEWANRVGLLQKGELYNVYFGVGV